MQTGRIPNRSGMTTAAFQGPGGGLPAAVIEAFARLAASRASNPPCQPSSSESIRHDHDRYGATTNWRPCLSLVLDRFPRRSAKRVVLSSKQAFNAPTFVATMNPSHRHLRAVSSLAPRLGEPRLLNVRIGISPRKRPHSGHRRKVRVARDVPQVFECLSILWRAVVRSRVAQQCHCHGWKLDFLPLAESCQRRLEWPTETKQRARPTNANRAMSAGCRFAEPRRGKRTGPFCRDRTDVGREGNKPSS